MNRNVESHFGNIPTKEIRRSKFKRPCSHKTTANCGRIIPIYRDEMLPGDTCKMKMSTLMRMTTPIDPVMDNMWADIYFFFIPRRLVWSHWNEFMGKIIQMHGHRKQIIQFHRHQLQTEVGQKEQSLII